ncbi:MAG: hypothetical protein Q8M15_07405 [Bacteroidota bacterium]|nr:hypothetical protein [Bacteroidota bacterium]
MKAKQKPYQKLTDLFLIGILLVIYPQSVFAQDKMLLRYRADTLLIKVHEIGITEIKYKLWPLDEKMPLIVESKDKVKRIIFENGTVMKFAADEFSDETNYTEQRKTALKIDPFSILFGMTSIAYEQSTKPGRSRELGLGLIGLGRNDNSEKNYGILIRAGYKFINLPDFYTKGMRYTHILKGEYIRPEFVFSCYSSTQNHRHYDYNTNTSYYNNDKYLITVFAFMLNFGKEYVFDDIFVVDAFAGIGIAIGSETDVDVNEGYYEGKYSSSPNWYGILTPIEGEINIAGQCGLKVGILVGKKKIEIK